MSETRANPYLVTEPEEVAEITAFLAKIEDHITQGGFLYLRSVTHSQNPKPTRRRAYSTMKLIDEVQDEARFGR